MKLGYYLGVLHSFTFKGLTSGEKKTFSYEDYNNGESVNS